MNTAAWFLPIQLLLKQEFLHQFSFYISKNSVMYPAYNTIQ